MESRGRDEKEKDVQLLNKEHMGADFEDPKKGSRAEKYFLIAYDHVKSLTNIVCSHLCPQEDCREPPGNAKGEYRGGDSMGTGIGRELCSE